MSERAKVRAALLAVLLLLLGGSVRPAAAQDAVLGGLLGAGGGVVTGTTVTLGLIVFNARTERDFIESPADLIGLNGIPIVAGLAGGLVLGAAEPDELDEYGIWTGGGMAVGAGLGALIGEAVTRDDPSGKWAGGVIGAAAGALLGVLVASL